MSMEPKVLPMVDDFKVRFAVDTVARALQSGGSEVKLLGFDLESGQVQVAARLNPDCDHCVMTGDQLQSLIKDMVEEQIGRPVSVQVSEL